MIARPFHPTAEARAARARVVHAYHAATDTQKPHLAKLTLDAFVQDEGGFSFMFAEGWDADGVQMAVDAVLRLS